MAKNLDGIKKLSSEEIKKNRKIILNYIGEKDPESTEEPKIDSRAAPASNKVDGIKSNKILSLKPKAKSMLEKPEPVKDSRDGGREEINLEKEKSEREKIKRRELVKREIAERAEREAEEKMRVEEAKNSREKLRLEERKRGEERIIEENKRLEKAKRMKEIERIKREIELNKKEAAEKRKIKRQKAIRLFKKNAYNKIGEIFFIVKRNFVYGALYSAAFLIIGYVVFCSLVLRFKIDNNIIRGIARFLPAPAVVTSQGIINYYDFRDIRDGNYADLNSAEKKNILAKWVVLKNLSKKYGLPVNSPGEALAIKFVADEDFNQVGLSRIKKISELLKSADDMGQLSKYADEYSDAVYYSREEAAEKFGQAALSLSPGRISDVIFRDSGYYIAQIVDSKNGLLGVKHLFIGAKTLDRHIGEKTAKIKIFILAN